MRSHAHVCASSLIHPRPTDTPPPQVSVQFTDVCGRVKSAAFEYTQVGGGKRG